MTLGEIDTKITKLTGADTTRYPQSERIIDINIWQKRVASAIRIAIDGSNFDDYNQSDYSEFTFPLVAGQRDYRFAQNEKIVKIKSLSLTYDGVNYYPATQRDFTTFDFATGPASATAHNLNIDGNFTTTNPVFDVEFNSIRIFPAPTAAQVTAGAAGYISWTREVTELTEAQLSTGTLVPGFAYAYHQILAYGPAYEWCLEKNRAKAPAIKALLDEDLTRLGVEYSTFIHRDGMFLGPITESYS